MDILAPTVGNRIYSKNCRSTQLQGLEGFDQSTSAIYAKVLAGAGVLTSSPTIHTTLSLKRRRFPYCGVRPEELLFSGHPKRAYSLEAVEVTESTTTSGKFF